MYIFFYKNTALYKPIISVVQRKYNITFNVELSLEKFPQSGVVGFNVVHEKNFSILYRVDDGVHGRRRIHLVVQIADHLVFVVTL